jgi:tetratricopeptide (TPR) repeat protein
MHPPPPGVAAGVSLQNARRPGRRAPAALAAILALAGLLAAGAPPAPAAAAPARKSVSLLRDPVFVAASERGLGHLYAMRYADADRQFAAIAARYPGHPVGPFLRALPDWWRILADPHDPRHDARFEASIEQVIRNADRRLDRDRNDLDGKFFKGAALAFRGRFRSLRGDWLAAAVDCKRALALVRDVERLDPGNADLDFGLGLYDYFADVLPARYPILKPATLFMPDADRRRGLRSLERVATQGRFVDTESAYFLLQIHMFFEKDAEESLRWAHWLRRRHPGNSVFHELEGRLYARWGRRDRARRVLADVLDRWQAGAPGYTQAQAERALYVSAVLDMRDGEHRAALGKLAQLDRLPETSGQERPLQTLGRLRQGMALDALGQRDAAVSRYRQVLARGDVDDAHQRARGHLSRPFRSGEIESEPAS